MKTVCCSNCERQFECAKHAINNNGVNFSEDYYNYGSYSYRGNGYEVKYWCGELGDYKMFEQIAHKWNKLYDKTPPVNVEVEVKFIENGKEKTQVNKLIPMTNGKYVWQYCDYDDCDEVVAWRHLPLKT